MHWLTKSIAGTTRVEDKYELDEPHIRQLLFVFTANSDDFGVRLLPKGSDQTFPQNGPLKYPGGYLLTFDVDLHLDPDRKLLVIEADNTSASARSYYIGIVTYREPRVEYQIAESLLGLNDSIAALKKLLETLRITQTKEAGVPWPR